MWLILPVDLLDLANALSQAIRADEQASAAMGLPDQAHEICNNAGNIQEVGMRLVQVRAPVDDHDSDQRDRQPDDDHDKPVNFTVGGNVSTIISQNGRVRTFG